MKLLFTADWLRGKIATDPDIETEAGTPFHAQRKIGVDSECVHLARHFLSDYTADQMDLKSLSEAIQSAVEDWFAERKKAVQP